MAEFTPYMVQILRALESQGEDHILRLIQSEPDETLQLEFKTKRNPTQLALDRDDKQNIGKTHSGFSNAEGGIVIWGVRTQKNENGIDKAVDTRPLADIDKFLDVFKSQSAGTLSPENSDIKYSIVRCKDNENKGYLIVAVPKGSARPYMSNAPDHNKFYRRTLLGCQPLEYYEVVDMMRAEIDPIIALNWTVIHGNTQTSGTDFTLRLLQHNVGSVVANRPYTIFENWPHFLKAGSHVLGNIKIDPPEIGHRAVVPSYDLDALVPGEVREFLILNFHTKGSYEGPFFWGPINGGQNNYKIADSEFQTTVGASNGSASKILFKLTVNEMRMKCLAFLK